MNWTTTNAPFWHADCEALRRLQTPFELREAGPANERFIDAFAERFDLAVQWNGSTVIFSPKAPSPLQPISRQRD